MADDEGSIYVVHWTHTPENCPGRTKEGAKMLVDFWARREEFEKKGIRWKQNVSQSPNQAWKESD